MNTETNRSEQPRTSENSLRLRLRDALIKNWPWKLLALFLAVCLWAGLITQDPTLTRERVFSDVPLTVTGADSLRRNSGLIVVSGLEEENLNVRLRVDVPQREYSNVTAVNYNPRLDLTRINGAGEKTLRVSTTSTTTYGVVQDVSPSTITVMVDEYVTNYRVPVVLSLTGAPPEGFHSAGVSLDPSVVAISGPKTIVDQIARVSVEYDQSRQSAHAGRMRTALPMRFLDSDGNEIESDQLEVSSAGVVLRTIIAEQTLYPTAMIKLSDDVLTSGEPARGYRVSKVSIQPESLMVAGNADALARLEELFVLDPVELDDAKESFTATVRARRPSELAYLSTDSIVVTVEIEPVEVSRTFGSVKLQVRGTGSDLKANIDQDSASLVVTGPQLLLENLRASKVSAYVDVTGLKAGTYRLPVKLHVEETDDSALSSAATPGFVNVTLTKH